MNGEEVYRIFLLKTLRFGTSMPIEMNSYEANYEEIQNRIYMSV
jgi:hypothetical protein